MKIGTPWFPEAERIGPFKPRQTRRARLSKLQITKMTTHSGIPVTEKILTRYALYVVIDTCQPCDYVQKKSILSDLRLPDEYRLTLARSVRHHARSGMTSFTRWSQARSVTWLGSENGLSQTSLFIRRRRESLKNLFAADHLPST